MSAIGGKQTVELAQNTALVLFVATVVFTDWRWRRIPNLATYPAVLLGLALASLEGLPGAVLRGGLLDHVAAVVGAFLFTVPLYAVGGLKAGDVKLLMAVGALKGVVFLFYAALIGALLGGAYAIAYVVVRRVVWRESLRDALHAFMPYGVALGIGALAALGFGVAR